MSDIYIALGSGGGISSDEVTAASSHVLQGQTYVGVDTNDEIGIGTMPNNPAQNVSLNCGQSVAIPLGYNPGSTITANSLASQTGGATADDSKVLSSYTYWKDGVKRTGNLAVSSVVSFNVAQYSNLTLIASWALPSRGPWSGLRVVCKQGGYPSHASDGTLFYEGSGTAALVSLAGGVWYFRAWNYITTNSGRIYGSYIDGGAINNQTVHGQQTFTSSGTFVVPNAVRSIQVFCVGGGCNGGGGFYSGTSRAGGGGGGGYTNTGTFQVTPGTSYYVEIGAGGASADTYHAGATTSVSGLISANGGGGTSAYGPDGKDGGSGGGGGGCGAFGGYAGAAGFDGGNGGTGGNNNSYFHKGGKGQGSTTRAFGEASGTLYAGGGGGGVTTKDGQIPGGAGGGGAGGLGSVYSANGANASFGTGGGGGGGGAIKTTLYSTGGAGGSGVVIIRW